jgi:RNA-splicing ligase RtcB
MTPNPDPELAQIEQRVLRAADALLECDPYLLTCDLNERSITHKFAEHLQQEFREWNVDCEYNRDRHDPKRLALPPRHNIDSDDLHAKTVFPDIIIHRRGTDENIAVVEVKKSTNPEGDEWDLMKLAAFKNQLGYRVALFFRFKTNVPVPAFEWRRCEAGKP